MKNLLKNVSLVLCTCFAVAAPAYAELNANIIRAQHPSQDLAQLHSTAASQTAEIENILNKVHTHLNSTSNAQDEVTSRGVDLLRSLTRSMSTRNIYTLNEEGLTQLLKINTALVDEILNYTSGNTETIRSFDASQFAKTSNNFASREKLEAGFKALESKIKTALHQVRELNLTSFNKAMRCVGSHLSDWHVDTVAKRSWPYIVYGLYILRQHRDDFEKWNNPVLKKLKQIVGCPNKKTVTLQFNGTDFKNNATYSRDENGDITVDATEFKDLMDAAKEAGYKIVKDKDARDCNFLRNWFGVSFKDGSVFEIPLALLFVNHVKQDLETVSNWSSEKLNGLKGSLVGEEL